MAKRRREIWASVTERGQVTIPAEVRKLLGIGKREKVVFVLEDGKVAVKKPAFTIETAAGSVPPLDPPQGWHEIKRTVAEERARAYLEKCAAVTLEVHRREHLHSAPGARRSSEVRGMSPPVRTDRIW